MALNIKVVQTSDPFKYRKMLEATAQTAIRYCELHELSYESYVGIKRGYYGCHATFNRMFILTELIERGYDGWVLYMDADAYFYDMTFDLRQYLAERINCSAVMATIEGETTPWHINAGVLMFNLRHPNAAPLIFDWKRRFMELSDEHLIGLTSVWGEDNDQGMLFQSLDDHPALRATVFFEQSRKINHIEGEFIRQYLGCFDDDIVSRTRTVEKEVSKVLERDIARNVGPAWDTTVNAIYRACLGRDADKTGLADYSHDLQERGLSAGLEHILRSLLNSKEAHDLARGRAGIIAEHHFPRSPEISA